MNNFTDFIADINVVELYVDKGNYLKDVTPEEIPNLPFPKKKFLDLGKYNQFKRIYESHISNLENRAIVDLLSLPVENIKMQYRLLLIIKEDLSKALKTLFSLAERDRQGQMNKIDLEIEFYPFFNVPPHESGNISQDFIYDLHDAIMFKRGAVSSLIWHIENVLGIKKEEPKKDVANEVTETIDSRENWRDKIEDYCYVFYGSSRKTGIRFMDATDYENFVQNTETFLSTSEIPKDITAVETHMSNSFIRYNIYLLWSKHCANKISRDNMIYFLHKSFSQFGDNINNTKKHFSDPPDNYYEKMKDIKYE
jgi:hypothetical protein